MNSKIQAARKHISDYELQLETARQEVKDCRAALKTAIRELYREIDNDANGVQDLPFDGDGEPSADHEEDEPDYHGEPVAELEALADEGLIERKATARRSNRKAKA